MLIRRIEPCLVVWFYSTAETSAETLFLTVFINILLKNKCLRFATGPRLYQSCFHQHRHYDSTDHNFYNLSNVVYASVLHPDKGKAPSVQDYRVLAPAVYHLTVSTYSKTNNKIRFIGKSHIEHIKSGKSPYISHAFEINIFKILN